LAITFFAVRDLATADLAFGALAADLEPRLVAAAFLLLAVFAVLLERALLLDTTCAWDRHAPVHGLSGESIDVRPRQKGADTDSGFSNVPKIAHFPQKSMIYDRKSKFGPP
jgi:hypothetical protein